MQSLIFDKDQFWYNCLKPWLVKKKANRKQSEPLSQYCSSFIFLLVTANTKIAGDWLTSHLMKVPPESIHKVTLMFLQHPHQSLQLSQPEALLDGASGLKGNSSPLQQIHTLQRVCLQTRLPQSGPGTSANITWFNTTDQYSLIQLHYIFSLYTFCMLTGHSSYKHSTLFLFHSCLFESRILQCRPF